MAMGPGFDALAPHYWWLERLTFGPLLHWCRTAMLPHIGECRRALVIGDGDGRFLADLLRANAHVIVDSIDISPGMTALTRRRVAAIPGCSERTRFIVADVRSDPLPGRDYDLIITNFLLDCFPADELEKLIARLTTVSATRSFWIVGDFAVPRSAAARLVAGIAVLGMYAFFRTVTGIPASRLVDPAPFLTARQFALQCEASRLAGFLKAQLWVRRD